MILIVRYKTILVMALSINGSTAIMLSAEAVKELAKQSGINLKITEIYTKETVKELAFIAAQLRVLAETVSNQSIKIVEK